MSIKTVLNTGEFLQETNEDKSLATFWLKLALKMADKLDPVSKARTLTIIGEMCLESDQVRFYVCLKKLKAHKS